MEIVAIGDKVPLGTFHLLSRFEHAVNYRSEACIISFIDSDKHLSGRTLQVSRLPRGKDPVEVGSADIAVARTRVSRSRAYRYDSAFEGFSPEQNLSPLVVAMKTALDVHAPDRSLAVLYHPRQAQTFASAFEKVVLQRFLQAFGTLRQGDLLGCVERFKGVGFGLTPSGDDFIIGLLYALSSLPPSGTLCGIKHGILEKAAGCTGLSWQFMIDAEAGIFPKSIKELFTAAQGGDENGMKQHILNTLEHGHSSGADTLAGMVAGFEWYAAQRPS